jgi:hypothetical protein
MPTISKLIAAVFFGVTAFFAAEAYKLGMPEGTQYGQFNALCAVIGLACGWVVMGNLTGKGYRQSAGTGMRTSVTFVVWALLACSIVLMVRKAFKKRYDTPMEAIVDIFALGLEHGLKVFTPEVLGILLVGGVVGGLSAEWAKKRWD